MKVFCLGCKWSRERAGLWGGESGSFGCVSSYQVVGKQEPSDMVILLMRYFLLCLQWKHVFCFMECLAQ